MERALPEVVLADCPAAWLWALFSGEFWVGLFCEAPGTRPQLAVNPVSSIKVMQNTNFLFIWPRSMPRGTEACAQSIKSPKNAVTLISAIISVREPSGYVKQRFSAYSQLYAHYFRQLARNLKA